MLPQWVRLWRAYCYFLQIEAWDVRRLLIVEEAQVDQWWYEIVELSCSLSRPMNRLGAGDIGPSARRRQRGSNELTVSLLRSRGTEAPQFLRSSRYLETRTLTNDGSACPNIDRTSRAS